MVNDVGLMWSAELGMSFSVRNWRGEEWFDNYILEFAQPIQATTSEDIHNLIAQAQAEGWSVEQMQNRMELVFQQYMEGSLTAADFEWFTSRMPAYRRELIARVESMRMANAGSFNLFKDWDVSEKEWLATMDDRVRVSHAYAHGQVVGIDELFTLGSGAKMMHPLDLAHGAPVSEAMNCRCAIIPKL